METWYYFLGAIGSGYVLIMIVFAVIKTLLMFSW
jgi:hypothetical protein